MENNIEELNIKTLFSNSKYSIPIYQRNYAWGEKEITQLIQDIVDFAKKASISKYYIGSLVVYERFENNEVVFETIDGQQRFTTLSILLSVIKNEYTTIYNTDIDWFKLNLGFDSRRKSTETLKEIYSKGPFLSHKEYNEEIRNGYSEAKKSLARILNENSLSIQDFYSYLINNVIIIRVAVPKDTDLNHYFEIMNSRGEQLEKHEILKANCLELIKDDIELSYSFNLIWEACANMERYVQYGFNPDLRNIVFGTGNWNNLVFDDIESMSFEINKFFKDNKKEADADNNKEFTLKQILENKQHFTNKSEGAEHLSERFTSVINFSNFLLHVLRVQTKENIPLDDKRLIDVFQPFIKNEDKKEAIKFVKEFGFNLLKCKYLFDNYIIKREFTNNKESWSLMQVKQYDGNKINYVNTFETESNNKKIIMLLSMFHVSTPTLVYKHWLNAAINFVFDNKSLTDSDYIIYLEGLAKSFLFDRYLSNNPTDYFKIIYNNKGFSKNSEINEELLNKGTSVENFIFNYYHIVHYE